MPNYAAMRSLVTKWLQESLMRGDLPRLLQPLLVFLLAATTKRIGVVHAHMQRKSGATNEYSEKFKSSGIDIWYNPDELRPRGNTVPDLDADDINLIAVRTENGNVAYQKVTDGKAKESTVAAGSSNGGGGGLNSCNDNSFNKAKRSPIRTIQEKIFGVGVPGSGVVHVANTRLPLSGANVTNTSTTNISVIINPMETTTMPRMQCGDSDSNVDDNLLERGRSIETLAFNSHVLHDGDLNGNDNQVLSSSAPTGCVNFLVSDPSDDDDDHISKAEDNIHEENTVEKVMVEAVPGLSQLENYSDDEDLSWQQPNGQDSWLGHETVADERSSCDSIKMTEAKTTNRFVGDVSRIADVMSEHDRTKNKKNYSLETIKVKLSTPKDESAEKKKVKKKRFSGTSKDSSGSGESRDRYSDSVSIKQEPSDLEELLTKSNIDWEQSKRNVEILRENNRKKPQFVDKIHPLHSHILLYHGVYDTKRVLYCLHTLKNILGNEPRTFLVLSMTTSVSDANIKGLLIR